jgi:hypothetical protein
MINVLQKDCRLKVSESELSDLWSNLYILFPE